MKAPTPARPAADPGQSMGWWTLEAHEVERRASGEREPMYGGPARAVIVFGADGKLMTVIAPAEDAAAVPARDAAASGRMYQVDGHSWATHHLVGEKLHLVSAWYSSPSHDYEVVRDHLVWSRVPLV